MNIEFVSYTGKFPNLCSGVLTLSIDGVQYRFGHDYSIIDSWKTDGKYSSFWCSGGCVQFSSDWSDVDIETSPWIIDKNFAAVFR